MRPTSALSPSGLGSGNTAILKGPPPAGAGLLEGGLFRLTHPCHGPEQIDGGDNPHEGRAAENRQAADAVLYHESRRFVSLRFRSDRDDLPNHDLADPYLLSPRTESLTLFGSGDKRREERAEIAIRNNPDKALTVDNR